MKNKRVLSSIVVVIFLLIHMQCKPDIPVPMASANDYIKIFVKDTTTTRADGSSVVKITASLPKETADIYKKVSFTFTSLGTPITTASAQTINANGESSVFVRLGQDSGTHIISVSLDESSNYKKDIIYILKPSMPDSIILDVNKSFTYTSDTTGTTVTATLKRTLGLVSKGITITAKAYQTINNLVVPVGRIESLVTKKTDVTGQIGFNFYADTGDVNVSYPVTIEVSSLNRDLNKIITGSINLKMK